MIIYYHDYLNPNPMGSEDMVKALQRCPKALVGKFASVFPYAHFLLPKYVVFYTTTLNTT